MSQVRESFSGWSNKWSPLSGLTILKEIALLEYTIKNLAKRVLIEQHVLRTFVNDSNLGIISASIAEVLNNDQNWWPNQPSPVKNVLVAIDPTDLTGEGDFNIKIEYEINPAAIQIASSTDKNTIVFVYGELL